MKSKLLVFLVLCLWLVSSENPEELGEKFQGDIMLTKEQFVNLEYGGRNALIAKRYRWPKKDGKVIVHYLLRSDKEFAEVEKDEIRSALDELEQFTCVRFIEGRAKNFIGIIAGRGCYSQVGKKGGLQILSLQRRGCVRKAIIMHEFLHALGFFHMQSAYDRDKYVKVNFENIKPGQQHNFAKHSNQYITHFKLPYDLDSIMHYSKKAFSKNGKNTIEAREPENNDRIGQRIGLSFGDIYRVNKMYGCETAEWNLEDISFEDLSSEWNDELLYKDNYLNKSRILP